ncbi:MAG TPA: hypothetical protein VK969_12600 [Acidimicrobiia bacterium]|nr:hypothetical protein [Acidimicrobiia bacterium]
MKSDEIRLESDAIALPPKRDEIGLESDEIALHLRGWEVVR